MNLCSIGAFHLLVFRLADAIELEPLLISQLVRQSILQVALNALWEGLATHRWTDAQLVVFSEKLDRIDLLADLAKTLRGERAFGIRTIGDLRRDKAQRTMFTTDSEPPLGPTVSLFPSGWLYQNQIAISRMYQDNVIPGVNASAGRISPQRLEQAERKYAELKSTPFQIMAKLLFPAVAKAGQKFGYHQTAIDLATIACALERCRLAQGRYPEQLNTLVPAYLKTVPHDIISGQPMHYKPGADDSSPIYRNMGLLDLNPANLDALRFTKQPILQGVAQ